MSQDIRTNNRVSDPPSDPVPIQPTSVETYADKLMDELFSDIDRILEGGSAPPTEPAQPEYVSLQPVKIPQMTLPSAATVIQEPSTQEPNKTSKAPQTVVEPAKDVADKPSSGTQKRRFGKWSDKVLWGVGLASLATLLLVWLASQQRLNRLFALNPTLSPNTQKIQISQADAQFISYMLKSLEVIDRKAEVRKQQATTATIQPGSNQPPVIAGSNIAPAVNRVPTILDQANIPTSPQPSQAATKATQRASAAKSTKAVTPASKAQLAKKPTLVALAEKGDRSVMFQINGVNRRIKVGETIATTGWTLVTVAKQEAIIRRNGEVRSISIGQKL